MELKIKKIFGVYEVLFIPDNNMDNFFSNFSIAKGNKFEILSNDKDSLAILLKNNIATEVSDYLNLKNIPNFKVNSCQVNIILDNNYLDSLCNDNKKLSRDLFFLDYYINSNSQEFIIMS